MVSSRKRMTPQLKVRSSSFVTRSNRTRTTWPTSDRYCDLIHPSRLQRRTPAAPAARIKSGSGTFLVRRRIVKVMPAMRSVGQSTMDRRTRTRAAPAMAPTAAGLPLERRPSPVDFGQIGEPHNRCHRLQTVCFTEKVLPFNLDSPPRP